MNTNNQQEISIIQKNIYDGSQKKHWKTMDLSSSLFSVYTNGGSFSNQSSVDFALNFQSEWQRVVSLTFAWSRWSQWRPWESFVDEDLELFLLQWPLADGRSSLSDARSISRWSLFPPLAEKKGTNWIRNNSLESLSFLLTRLKSKKP